MFRWFVGLSADDPVWDATVFCKNRDRLLAGDIAAKSTVTNAGLRDLFAAEVIAFQTPSLTNSDFTALDPRLVLMHFA